MGAAAIQPSAINRHGQLTGWAGNDNPAGTPRAFLWSDAGGVRDLGALGPGATVGEAINDAGMVAGTSLTTDGRDHAFAWTTAGGMVDLGAKGGSSSSAHLINNAGQVAGSLQVAGNIAYHGFVWNQASGMVDIGTLGGDYSTVSAMNQAGQVAGGSQLGCGDCFHAITWTAAGGLADLGVLGGIYSDAFGINARGEVVGWADSASSNASFLHAFVWTAANGMVDLNRRIPNAPAGLELTSALAISDDGAIVADSNAGMVLLMPGARGTDAPVVGPIQSDGPVSAGTPVAFTASFSDRNSADRHSATWSWNDGCGADAVSKVGGPGTVRANHTFCAPGEYWISFKVTDSSGRSTTVGRYLMVDDAVPAGPAVAGSGWFVSPRGACKQQPLHSGPATFGFVARAAGERKATLRFHVAKLSFESAAYDTLSVAGGRAQYQGSGKLNGAGNYRFVLEAVGVGDASSRGRLRMKIWHLDARSKALVVDYDNQGNTATAAIVGEGSAVAGGSILVRQ
jgi:probable HAF family extracellular repeat protein